ncbi:hypothetical protein [Pseudaminobacter sp. NGMCC 1.201702]|uniref:hypothetical protein n=1 Tax=Pseudaminobacter sp. NGMCC 1.201702 TaxID=3391825 RepID=UPI0039F01608
MNMTARRLRTIAAGLDFRLYHHHPVFASVTFLMHCDPVGTVDAANPSSRADAKLEVDRPICDLIL